MILKINQNRSKLIERLVRQGTIVPYNKRIIKGKTDYKSLYFSIDENNLTKDLVKFVVTKEE